MKYIAKRNFEEFIFPSVDAEDVGDGTFKIVAANGVITIYPANIFNEQFIPLDDLLASIDKAALTSAPDSVKFISREIVEIPAMTRTASVESLSTTSDTSDPIKALNV